MITLKMAASREIKYLISMVATNFLQTCTAFELGIVNESIGVRSQKAVHLGKKFLAAIFSVIVYHETGSGNKAFLLRLLVLGASAC